MGTSECCAARPLDLSGPESWTLAEGWTARKPEGRARPSVSNQGGNKSASFEKALGMRPVEMEREQGIRPQGANRERRFELGLRRKLPQKESKGAN